MSDLNIAIVSKTQEAADSESAKVYPWLTSEIGNQGLPSSLFDSVAFVCHEITNNRLFRNSLTRQVRLRVSRLATEVVLSIRYDGEPFNDQDDATGPLGVRAIIVLANAAYGPGTADEGETVSVAGEKIYTTTRIKFPIPGSN